MIGRAPDSRSDGSARYAGVNPAIASAAVAVCALAFFRVWVVFSADLGGPAQIGLSGVELTQQIGRGAIWRFAVPAGLVLILLLSFLRLFAKSRTGKLVFALSLPVISLALGAWPFGAMGRILARLRVTSKNPGMTLSAWFWMYCLGLVVIMIIGAVELVGSLQETKTAR